MTDWTTVDLDTLLPGEPWTSGKALAVYENPIALAEGATGAPRVRTEAMGTLIAEADPAGAATVSFVDLDLQEYRIHLDHVFSASTSIDIECSISIDNGANWSAWFKVAETSSVDASRVGGYVEIQARARLVRWLTCASQNTTVNQQKVEGSRSGGFTGTDPVNAVRFRCETGNFNAGTGQLFRLFSTEMGVARE